MKLNLNVIATSLFLFFITISSVFCQNEIKPLKGYTTQIGNLLSMMEDLKSRVTYSVENLNQRETDFLLDEKANRIGAMILHLAATEKYYQLYTFENRGFNVEEKKEWEIALNLGKEGRENLVGKPISFYLQKWDKVREDTKRLLKTKDDKWLNSKVKGVQMNKHWAWYHVMEHQANHMGQIRLIMKRMEM